MRLPVNARLASLRPQLGSRRLAAPSPDDEDRRHLQQAVEVLQRHSSTYCADRARSGPSTGLVFVRMERITLINFSVQLHDMLDTWAVEGLLKRIFRVCGHLQSEKQLWSLFA